MPINYQGSGGGVPRKTAKIFAKNANANDMTVFGSTLANNTQYSTDLDSIQSTHYEVGWREAVISNLNYPLLSDMNAVQHTLSQQIAYTLQHGIPEYDAGTTYYAYDKVQYNDIIYTALQDNFSNKLPTNTDYWASYYIPGNYLTKQQITNCILESPLNVNLTLKDGVLKLYAGSKFYIPNGSGNFDEYTTTVDVTDTPTFNAVALIFPVVNNGTVSFAYYIQNSNIFVSATAPDASVFPSGITDGLWYDYVNNRFSQSFDTGSTWVNAGKVGFPIGITQAIGSGAFNIYQVFNGFGYFDNFVFYTPNVRVLAPWGRNADGSMNNVEYVTTNCYLQYFTPYLPTDSTTIYFFLNATDGSLTNIYMQDYYETPTQPIRTDTTIWYNTDFNVFDYKPQGNIGTVSWSEVPITKFCSVEIENGKIIKLNANYPVNLVDTSHSSWIGHQSMPREGGVFYTVGASEATYTAYYDGYIMVKGTASVDYDNYLYVLTNNRNCLIDSALQIKLNYEAYVTLPISAGDTFSITYGNMTNLVCRLIPLNGGS